MTVTRKAEALRQFCPVCNQQPGMPCWPNGNVHPTRHVTTPGPHIQFFDKDGWAMLYDSAVSDKRPEEFLASCVEAGVQVRIRVKGRGGKMWSGEVGRE